jgi:hypothetical protein
MTKLLAAIAMANLEGSSPFKTLAAAFVSSGLRVWTPFVAGSRWMANQLKPWFFSQKKSQHLFDRNCEIQVNL